VSEVADELAARRLPEWARKLADIKLGCSLGIAVMPHAKWLTENPGVQFTECPEHLLEVSIVVMGMEVHPSALNPDPNAWPRVNVGPVVELGRMPWAEWRRRADSQLYPTSEAGA